MYTHGALIPCALNNKSNNSSSSYYLLRAMYQPLWSVLYKVLSQSSDHLCEAHFTDKEADINLGWDEKETSSRGPRPSGQRCHCFKLSQVSVFSLLNTDFQQSEFVRSHTGTGGPNWGCVSGARTRVAHTRVQRYFFISAPSSRWGIGGRVWKMWPCAQSVGTWGLYALLSGMPALGRRGGSGHSFWTCTLGRIIPVFSGPPVRE